MRCVRIDQLIAPIECDRYGISWKNYTSFSITRDYSRSHHRHTAGVSVRCDDDDDVLINNHTLIDPLNGAHQNAHHKTRSLLDKGAKWLQIEMLKKKR